MKYLKLYENFIDKNKALNEESKLRKVIQGMFSSKPLGDVEGAKEMAIKVFKVWIKKNVLQKRSL